MENGMSRVNKLYSVPQNYRGELLGLVEANVVKETPLFFFVDSSALSGWSKRIEKKAVNRELGSHAALVATTPEMAWRIALRRAEDAQLAARLRMEEAIGAAQTAQLALDALREAK